MSTLEERARELARNICVADFFWHEADGKPPQEPQLTAKLAAALREERRKALQWIEKIIESKEFSEHSKLIAIAGELRAEAYVAAALRKEAGE